MIKKKQWREMSRTQKAVGLIGLGVIIIFVLGVIGAITGGGQVKTSSTKNSQPVSATNTPKDTSKPASPSATKTVTISGYGAPLSDWNANHTADTRYAKNSVYNPDPNLGYDNRYDAKYYTVSTQNGRVLNYSMRLPNGSSQTAATAEVMQEFPADASLLWQQAHTSDPSSACYQMEIKSNVLGQALSDPKIGDSLGEVFVEFYTETNQNSGVNSEYSPSNVNGALLQLGSYQTPADAPGC